MKVLFASVEMSPLAKVGGLGDVAGSLPRALRGRRIDARVAMPMHRVVDRTALPGLTHVLSKVRVPWPGGDEHVDVWETAARGVPVYLLENERYFARERIYGLDDDEERFLFYCDALLACASHLGFVPDVIHAHDWHTALLLTRLDAQPRHRWADTGRVYTIHNLALRGDFDGTFADDFGIAPQQLAAPDRLPPELAYSAMAQGILHADRVNTVSETYAKEIMTPEYGAGLDALLRARASVVSGIVNGIDYEEFNPATDSALVKNYSVDTLEDRAANKRALQGRAGLQVSADALLFGVVTRLFAQKGIDLVAVAFDAMLALHDTQLIVLGTGDEDVHRMLLHLEQKYPEKVKIWLDFNPPLGQQIYGGCDCFLMPSRYEPCGLGQLISLRYGAVPLVRRTGGLADTVQNADLPLRSGTGFVFDAANAHELEHAAERALAAFENKAGWRALQVRGMRQDWSWGHAAGKYIELYEAAVADRTAAREEAGA
ncbi:MAG: glycogen synthase [Chloroflexota bacterium]|nr:glycogen synthase [Chloroflexota bacterium]